MLIVFLMVDSKVDLQLVDLLLVEILLVDLLVGLILINYLFISKEAYIFVLNRTNHFLLVFFNLLPIS
jgi:hypothetical protein